MPAPAELPRATVVTAYPRALRQVHVPAGANLQTALNAAQPGDELLLAPGATYTGNFVLGNKSGAGWITVRTDISNADLGSAGTRMTPTRAASLNLARIVTPNSAPAFATALSAHHWRLTGLEIVAQYPAGETYGLVAFGAFGQGGQTSLAVVAHHLGLDRSYVHGSVTQTLRRCVELNSAETFVIDSWLADCHSNNSDSQGILGMNGPGPFLIQNNHIEGGHQAFMFGGGDPAIAGLVPSDITIRGNHMTRPLIWRSRIYPPAPGTWTSKTIIETKNARRVLIEGNVIENSWTSAWTGVAMTFKSVNQEGRCPWCITSDVTLRYNRIRNVGAGINVSGNPEGKATPAVRMAIYDNILDAMNTRNFDGPGDAFSVYGVDDVLIAHNTIISSNGRAALLFDVYPNQRFAMHSNILVSQYGLVASGKGTADGFAFYAPGSLFADNVLVGVDCGTYPRGTRCAPKLTDVGFVDLFGGDYHLGPESPYRARGHDGKDIGADVDKVLAATKGVVVAR